MKVGNTYLILASFCFYIISITLGLLVKKYFFLFNTKMSCSTLTPIIGIFICLYSKKPFIQILEMSLNTDIVQLNSGKQVHFSVLLSSAQPTSCKQMLACLILFILMIIGYTLFIHLLNLLLNFYFYDKLIFMTKSALP